MGASKCFQEVAAILLLAQILCGRAVQVDNFLDNNSFMINIFNKFLFATILIFVASCSVPHWWKPRGYLTFKMMPKGGSPGYNLGWVQGCESGMGTQFAGRFFSFFYTWHRDPDITSVTPNIEAIKRRYKKELKDVNWNDPADIKRNFADYNLVFWDAHYFCRQTILGTLQMSMMSPPLPGEERYNLGAHSVGNVWKINGKGDPRIGSTGPGGGLW